MEQAQNKAKIFIRLTRVILSAVFSVPFMALLGTFYRADDNYILVNILIWVFVISLGTLPGLLLDWIVFIASKRKTAKPIIFDGFSFLGGYLGILLFCLAITKTINDSQFVSVTTGIIAGVVTLIQFAIEMHKKINKNKKETN